MFKKTILTLSSVLLSGSFAFALAADNKNIPAANAQTTKPELINTVKKNDSKQTPAIASRVKDDPSNQIISNAFNYKNGLAVDVDPRTLTLSVNLPITKLKDQNGPALSLALGFSQYNSYARYTITGFSGGNLGISLPYIDTQASSPYIGTIHLPNGGVYKINTSPDNNKARLSVKSHKVNSAADILMVYLHLYSLNDVALFQTDGSTTAPDQQKFNYALCTLNGEIYYFDSDGTLVCISNQFNHYISITSNYDSTFKQSTINQITTSGGLIINCSSGAQGGTDINLPGKRKINIDYSGITYYITNYTNSQDPSTAQVMKVDFDSTLNLINMITYPTGLVEQFSYTTFDGTNIQHVSEMDVINNGNVITTKYEQNGSNNFIGGCTDYSDDCLMNTGSSYDYHTKITSGGVESMNTYDHLHLLTEQALYTSQQGELPLQYTKYTYSGDLNSDTPNPIDFDNNTYDNIISYHPNYQKPAITTQTTYATPAQIKALEAGTSFSPEYKKLLEEAAESINRK